MKQFTDAIPKTSPAVMSEAMRIMEASNASFPMPVEDFDEAAFADLNIQLKKRGVVGTGFVFRGSQLPQPTRRRA